MIDRSHELPVRRQAQLLGISRGTVYYRPEPISEAEQRLMRRIRACSTAWSTSTLPCSTRLPAT